MNGTLPEKGKYGVGMLFFTNDDEERVAIEQKINDTDNRGRSRAHWMENSSD